MSDPEDKPQLDRVQNLFEFLQGKCPDGCVIPENHLPHLTPEQAWTVIWWLGNEYWQVPDFIERCDVCGDLYDTYREGAYLDYGESPYNFCEPCMASSQYRVKLEACPSKLRNEYGLNDE